jgi:hypothetical protein
MEMLNEIVDSIVNVSARLTIWEAVVERTNLAPFAHDFGHFLGVLRRQHGKLDRGPRKRDNGGPGAHLIHPKLLLANTWIFHDRIDLTWIIECLQDAMQGLTRACVRRHNEVDLGVAYIGPQLLASLNSLRLALRREPQRCVWLGSINVKINITLTLSVSY